jgi:cytochrome c oxidase subunit 1
VLLVVGGVMLIYNVLSSLRGGEPAGDNPWHGDTLEWATSSPPPVYNFLEIPVVEGRHPLWDRSQDAPVVTGVRSDIREVLVTSVLDAAPLHKHEFPAPSIWPFLAAVVTSAMFVGLIFTPWALVAGALPVFITLTGWFWPKEHEHAPDESRAAGAVPSEAH